MKRKRHPVNYSLSTSVSQKITYIILQCTLENHSWELAKMSQPKSRSGHSMVAFGNSLVVFGGEDENKKLSQDLFIINGGKD